MRLRSRLEPQTTEGRGWREATAENEVNGNFEQGIMNGESGVRWQAQRDTAFPLRSLASFDFKT